jgi:hypothetical protein
MSYYVTNENSFLDIKNAHLRVTGNVHTDVLKVGSIGFQPAGSNIPGTVNFTNVITGVTTTSNLDVGGTLNLGTIELSASTHTLDHITARGNVTSTTVQFDNATTGLVTTANVEVGGELTVTGNTTVSENLTVSGNVSDLNVVSNVNMLHTSNTASIKLNSNVVAEFPRSKKFIKYPRVGLGTNTSPYSGLGGGSTVSGYTIKASGEYDGNFIASKAFTNTNDPAPSGKDAWLTTSGAYSSNTPVANSATLTKFGQQGSWLEIKLPNKIQLHSTHVFARGYHVTERNDTADIWASNTGTDGDWVKLTTINFNTTYTDTTPMVADIDTRNYYQYFAIQITRVEWSGAYANIGEWELYGFPEYDPEAHGTDVTVKSYPNVPNTDWLEVYYDAKNYTNGAVQDETSNNRDAEMNATFDNGTIKAFTFSGALTSNVTTSDHGLGTDDVTYTMSYWFKRTAVAGNYDYIVMLGNGGTAYSSSLMWINNNQLTLDHWGAALRVLEPIVLDKWYHVVAGHRGGVTPSLKNDFVYIDGIKVTPQITQTPAAFTLAGSKLTLGTSHSSASEYFNGSIANFRLFNRALTSDEAWQLYAYQKEYFGHGDLSMTLKAGRLGIGTSEPRAALDVRGTLDVRGNEGGADPAVRVDGALKIGPNWHIQRSGADLHFFYNDVSKAFIHWNLTGGTYMNFTGQHRTFIKNTSSTQVSELEGLIVSSDQNKYIKMSGGIEAGSNAITTNESLPIVSLSNVVTDKKCFGVISSSESIDRREDAFGSFVTVTEKEKGDTRVYINSVGEGAIWVSNIGGNLEAGDYITTSNVAGYGQKQESEFLANYTVAKITMDCDFNPATQSIQIIKKDEEDENVLDEHGQIQWEDHPTETEKAYKVRYLTADGAQTDEANTVHIAAFVGCTYHCG